MFEVPIRQKEFNKLKKQDQICGIHFKQRISLELPILKRNGKHLQL